MQISNPSSAYERGKILSCRLHPTRKRVGFRLATAVTTFTATATTGRIALDRDDPTDTTEFSAETFADDREYIISFEGELLRSGVWRTADVSMPTLNVILQTVDLQSAVRSYAVQFDVTEIVERTELDSVLLDVVSVIDVLEFTVQQAEDIRALLKRFSKGYSGFRVLSDWSRMSMETEN